MPIWSSGYLQCLCRTDPTITHSECLLFEDKETGGCPWRRGRPWPGSGSPASLPITHHSAPAPPPGRETTEALFLLAVRPVAPGGEGYGGGEEVGRRWRIQ